MWTRGAQGFSVLGLDADGNIIIGPGAPIPTLTSSDPTHVVIAPPAARAPNHFTVTLAGPADLSYTLTASLTPGAGSGASPLTVPLALSLTHPITEYAIPTNGSDPYGIATGPDGALWFTECSANKIGRITTAGAVSEYWIPTFNSDGIEITAGSDGALWFSEWQVGRVGRITPAGAEYTLPNAIAHPVAITSGPDGAIWFTELSGNKIGRL